ncbi:MAG TPA: hypothetical protein DEO70_05450 [Bacteroidales bacterium]|nr:MAG: hypothetical protein A2X11_16760 [Bacteroidetes bacterium GWE2_42_24]OFY25185.1 MAG: hypothetical protein A2X09_04920 [Bacteroidetes bacterium GWF2_43_11]HBZ66264.1 hypothetical protein [Bacteroidales bacterium]
MNLSGEAKLLRIFTGSQDKAGHTPLYEFIVYSAKRAGLAGATVLQGVMGFGAGSNIHSAKILTLSGDLPMVVEIVDEAEKIDKFVATIQQHLQKSAFGGMITTEKVNVIVYRPEKQV